MGTSGCGYNPRQLLQWVLVATQNREDHNEETTHAESLLLERHMVRR